MSSRDSANFRPTPCRLDGIVEGFGQELDGEQVEGGGEAEWINIYPGRAEPIPGGGRA
jgi:hypothetical protein